MGQLLLADNIPNLVKSSTTSLTLAATNNGQPTRIQVGGQQYTFASTLTLTASGASAGANALDVGTTLGIFSTYYVYAIVNQTTFAVALVASLVGPSTGPTMPSGYGTAYKLIGAFMADGLAQVGSPVSIVGEAVSGTFNTNMTQRGSSSGTAFTNITMSRTQGWRRGETLYVSTYVTFTGLPGTAAGAIQFILQNLQIDTTKLSAGSNNATTKSVGLIAESVTGANYTIVSEFANSSGNIIFTQDQVDGLAGVAAAWVPTSPVTLTANHRYSLEMAIPISGWNATLL